MKVESEIFDLIDRIYAASTTPALWQGVTEALADAFPGTKTVIFLHDEKSIDCRFMHFSGWNSTYIKKYVNYYSRINPFMGVAAKIPRNAPYDAYTDIDPELFFKTEFYYDFWRHQNISSAVADQIYRDGERFMIVNINDENHSRQEDLLRFLQQLSPHLRRAVQVQRHIAAADAVRQGAHDALEQLRVGVLLIDRRSRLRFTNTVSLKALHARDGLYADPSGRIRATENADDASLQRAIAGVLAGRCDGDGASLQIRRRDRSALSVLISPVSTASDIFTPYRAAALILVKDPDEVEALPEQALTRLYGLTQAEARLAMAIGRGDTVADYAAANDRSINTIRSQIRAILAKTDLHRQSDLVRLVTRQMARPIR